MNLENIMFNEVRHRRTNIVGFHSYEVPRIVKFTETETTIEVTAVGRGSGIICLMGVVFV